MSESTVYEDRMAKVKRSYVLFHIFLASIHSALAHLEAQLGGGVIYKAPEGRMHIVATRSGMYWYALLLAISISALGL